MKLKELIKEAISPQNVGKWNMAQIRSWKQFVKTHNMATQETKTKENYKKFVRKHNNSKINKIDENDIELLMKYALWFREFYMNKGKIPTHKEVPSLKIITTFQGKRQDAY